MAATTLGITIAIPGSCSRKKFVFLGHPESIRFNRSPPSHTAVVCHSRRRRNTPAPAKEIHKKTLADKNLEEEDDDIDEDTFEALFSQLEEDLKNDDLIGEDGDDDFLSEEELAKLEHELAEALEDDELIGALASIAHGDNDNEDDKEESDNLDDNEAEDEEESPIKLKNWQSRRLAYALKNGRRKTSIKNLAADLCLDRAVVLKLLRDPPPNLVMLSAALPEKPVPTSVELEEKIEEIVPLKQTPQTTKPKSEVKLPIHEMRNNWSARKRLKKVQVETLELVYRRTKRPTNAMISSIVSLTNLPRKRVVKWFEDKRAEDEVPDKRLPYHRSDPQTVFAS